MFRSVIAACAAVLVAGGAHAATLTANLQVDNEYTIYVSSDDNTAGTAFGSGTDWTVMGTHTFALTPGASTYLHIYGYDRGVPVAGLLGEFTLSSTDWEFANGTQTLLSGDSALGVSETGWGDYGATTIRAAKGGGLWGGNVDPAISNDAFWVWNGPSATGEENFFSAAVNYVGSEAGGSLPDNPSAVPLPASVLLLGAGLGALAVARRRKRAV